MAISPRPSTLSMKCAPSTIGSGRMVESRSRWESAAGVTPEKISAAPMASVSAERTRGERCAPALITREAWLPRRRGALPAP